MSTKKTKTKHTLEEAFGRFKLINGQGSEADNEACAMTLLAWICGEEWDDHPDCTHSLIADAVIRANDAKGTTPAKRRKLVELGREGALDTWWIPVEVIAYLLVRKPKKGQELPEETPYATATRLLRSVAKWKKDRQRPNLTDANLTDANLIRTHGNAYTVLPPGYEVNPSGLIVPKKVS